ncbi:hypothetical protein FB565_001528 [Actinoplanes lutulentus]|uniref:Uncharacterized protein DUF3307 n=1 Tax=Actinoplanes lutulentus TaxID=1287878 RepID=A0A327ZG06_9ACTN|nr:DUF3307 domain-containing protein [Actinoplanes lutulentus]MBB2941824.1 hypothetical protein [Actinoplanes lutulentus]RAK39743.1 uncharacterized protein DUF3307 [Actinoplanes lutulentus]
MTTIAVTFAAVAVTLHAAHQLGDHIIQTDTDAGNKAAPGRHGWRHVLVHVATYHLTALVMLAVTAWLLHLPITATGLTAGIGFSAATHAVIDRRWPVRWLLNNTGSAAFADRQTPICGMYLADQSLHYGCLWVAALLIACL